MNFNWLFHFEWKISDACRELHQMSAIEISIIISYAVNCRSHKSIVTLIDFRVNFVWLNSLCASKWKTGSKYIRFYNAIQILVISVNLSVM